MICAKKKIKDVTGNREKHLYFCFPEIVSYLLVEKFIDLKKISNYFA